MVAILRPVRSHDARDLFKDLASFGFCCHLQVTLPELTELLPSQSLPMHSALRPREVIL